MKANVRLPGSPAPRTDPPVGAGWRWAPLILGLATAVLDAGLPTGSGLSAAAAVQNGIVSSPVAGASTRGPDKTPAPAARSSPVWLRIPALGVAASVGPLGLNADGGVQVPKNPEELGWYRFGPSPGQHGSAVILGHLDSKTGPAIFYRLKSLRRGEKIVVTLADHTVVHFQVDRVVTYPNAKFPALKVYGSRGRPALQLVTCGGPYDHHTHSYTANVVVYTFLVSITGTRHRSKSG